MPLFYKGGTAKQPNELTEPQIALYSWLRYYQWLTSGDGPEISNEILNDDYAVDDFVSMWKTQIEKKKKDMAKADHASGQEQKRLRLG